MASLESPKSVGRSAGHPKEEPDGSTPVRNAQAERTYVLDTSVLLSDPRALFRFAEHAVVLPVVVIAGLEEGLFPHSR